MRRAKQGPLHRWQKRNSIYGVVPKKKKKRHSVFLFSLLVFILSYWPTTLASLWSRPTSYQQVDLYFGLFSFLKASCIRVSPCLCILFALTFVSSQNQQQSYLCFSLFLFSRRFLSNSMYGRFFCFPAKRVIWSKRLTELHMPGKQMWEKKERKKPVSFESISNWRV